MNSIISLSWQLEINDCPIPITILKNRCQQPHHYFYSSKQNRVLRKKNPNIFSLISQSQNKSNPSKLLKIYKNVKNKLIQFQFCEGCAALSDLQQSQFQGQFCIIQNGFELCRVALKAKGNSEQIEVEYLTCQKPIINKEQQIRSFIQNLKKHIIQGMSKKMFELKLSKQKQNNNKIIFIQLILGINEINKNNKQYQIIIIQIINMKFINKQLSIYQIQFQSILSKQQSNISKKLSFIQQNILYQIKQNINYNQQNNNNNNINNNSKQISNFVNNQPSKNIIKIIQQPTIIQCKCCSSKIPFDSYKEITSEEIIYLRKSCKLAIRGFNEKYYQVCYDCYMKL